MKSIRIIITLIIFTGIFSCTEKIDLHISDTNLNLLVVDGMITSDTTSHLVTLSTTGNLYIDQPTNRVSGAQLTISDNLGNEFPLTETEQGVYKTASDVYGVPHRTYTLKIHYDGQVLKAESTMNRIVEIDSLGYRYELYKDSYRILLYGQEPAGKGDHYMWHLYKNGKLLTNSLDKILFGNDEFIDGNYIHGMEVDWWNQDFNFQIGDTVTVAHHSITSEYFNFAMAASNEGFSGEGFGFSPGANIEGNISNNALGMFHASAVVRKTIIIGE